MGEDAIWKEQERKRSAHGLRTSDIRNTPCPMDFLVLTRNHRRWQIQENTLLPSLLIIARNSATRPLLAILLHLPSLVLHFHLWSQKQPLVKWVWWLNGKLMLSLLPPSSNPKDNLHNVQILLFHTLECSSQMKKLYWESSCLKVTWRVSLEINVTRHADCFHCWHWTKSWEPEWWTCYITHKLRTVSLQGFISMLP